MPSKDAGVTLPDLQLDKPATAARIVVAMSGGVDSSVAAMIAARSGAEVIGVTLQLYDHGEAVKRSGARSSSTRSRRSGRGSAPSSRRS